MTERLLRLGRLFALFVGIGLWLAAGPLGAAPSATLIMDARSGAVLFEQNANARLHPASLTKMMTLYIVFQEIEAGRLSLDGLVTVSKHAAAQPPSRLGLKPGQKIALRYLIRAAAIKSANDAATALGEAVSGSESAFAQRMTATARALGMNSTTFRNANGLTAEGHLSTARDMSVLGRHLFYDFPQYYGLFSQRSSDAGVATVHNSNTRFLDAYPGADGIKTGFTVAAGFNLVASAKRGNKRLIVTVFGAPSTAARNARVAELLDRGFGQVAENVAVRRPQPAPLLGSGPAAVASSGGTEDDEAGGAGKTVRVSGAVERSYPPRPRPAWLGNGPDATALAIAADVAGTLGQPVAPEAEQVTEVAIAAEEAPTSPVPTAIEAPPPAPATVPEPAPSVLAEAETTEPAPPPDTFEAQALALADGDAGESPSPEVAGVPAAGEAETVAEAVAVAAGLPGGQRPPPRPEGLTVAAADAVGPDSGAGGADPAAEGVGGAGKASGAEAGAAPERLAVAEAPEILAEAANDIAAADAVTAIETVASPAPAADVAIAEAGGSAEAAVAEPRHAPIFETVATAGSEVPEEMTGERLVVSKSTSGGQDWGVHVGSYASRSEAERALVKMGLAESATLDHGLRKVTQASKGYRASFLGLSREQADLACRRIRARGVDCLTSGPA